MTIVLHIGMQKTASTSIQRTMTRMSRWGNSRYIKLDISNSNSLHTNYKDGKRKAFEKGVSELVRAVGNDADPAMNHVISSENLPMLPAEGVEYLLTELARTGQHIRVVTYVRKPVSFMESMFQQRLKRRLLADDDVRQVYPQYRRKFGTYEKMAETLDLSVEYWPFLPKEMEHGCVVRDFGRRIGSPIRAEDVVQDNFGLSQPALSLLYNYRSEVEKQESKSEKGRMVKRLAKLKGPKLRFHPDLVAPILKKYRSDIEWMETRLGVSLEERPAADDDPAAIRAVSDLGKVHPDTVSWLMREVGVTWKKDGEPTGKQLARWTGQLMRKSEPVSA